MRTVSTAPLTRASAFRAPPLAATTWMVHPALIVLHLLSLVLVPVSLATSLVTH